MSDILFKTNDFVFSYRVAGIIIHNGKILLQKPENDDYAIPGGHVAIGETTEECLKREFLEEINSPIDIKRLYAVGEIFFPWGKKPCHQISLYYLAEISDETSIPMDGVFKGIDEIQNKKYNMEFCWVPLDKLKDIVMYPKELVPYLIKDSDEIIHFISNQL